MLALVDLMRLVEDKFSYSPPLCAPRVALAGTRPRSIMPDREVWRMQCAEWEHTTQPPNQTQPILAVVFVN